MNYSKYLFFFAALIIFSTPFAGAGAIADPAGTVRSYYVSASGSDENNGLSELFAFRTLAKAVEAASNGNFKRVTVIGVLDNETENSGAKINIWNMDSAFSINDSGGAEIIITGRPGAGAALKGGDGKRVISILGNSNIRFENILITGGSTDAEGGGIYAINGTSVTLAEGAVLSGNFSCEGGGIYIEDGSLTLLANAAIINNAVSTDEGGGAVVVSGVLVMADNSKISGNSGGGLIVIDGEGSMKDNSVIADNRCEYDGGGACIYMSDFTMRGQSQISNNQAGRNGGGIWMGEGMLLIFEEASINGNEASVDGGGVNLEYGSLVLRGFADISGNKSGDDGGGIHNYGGSVLLDENAILADNESTCGGGLCIEYYASAVIRGEVEVLGNSAIGPQGGGGLCAGYNSTIHMTGGVVADNISTRGGGVYIERANFIFDGGYIFDNEAESGGGIYAAAKSFLRIGEEAVIEDNKPNNTEQE
ncbi:MAG: hypothetical protein LBI06_05925 [Treponema sp.]|jgi:hypothetical protein|nr:hypothetical protein [Treponema sp.]